MSSQSQSQVEESNKLVLQNRDLMQLMGLANLEQKLPKSTVLKINISDALEVVHKHINQIEIRLYGNLVFSISKGILRTLNVINLDLKETISLMQKNIKIGKEEGEIKVPKAIKKERIALPTTSTTESKDEKGSVSSIEKPLHVSTHDRITVPEKFTPHRFAEIEAPRDSLQAQFDFTAQMEGIEPIDFPSGAFGKPTTFEGLSPMQFPTPQRFAELISPAKPKQTFPNLDVYLESVKKGTEKIFEEEPEAEEEEEEEEEVKGRRRGPGRKRGRKPETAPALEARWDYDEKPILERVEEEKETTDADLFIRKIQAPTVQPLEQKLAVNVGHFLNTFTADNLEKFNQKVKDLKEEQFLLGMTSERGRADFDLSLGLGYHPEAPSEFLRGDITEPSIFMPFEEGVPFAEEEGFYQPSRLDEIGLSIEKEKFDEKITTSEVLGTMVKMLEGRKKGTVSFERLVQNESKIAKANMFYEILNLSKENKVELTQRKPHFGEIEITVL